MTDLQYNGNSVIVWCDGACFNNNSKSHKRKAGCGVFFNDDHDWNAYGPLIGASPTNNNAEIEAGIQAVNICSSHSLSNVEIRTDSTLLIQGVEMLHSWKNRNWVSSKGQEVVNRIKFQLLDKVIASTRMKITWVKVRGHNKEKGNVQADKLAKMGARKYKPICFDLF